MPKFVKPSNTNAIRIQFHCGECNKKFITTIDNFSKSYSCSRCRAIVNTLPIFCQYDGCSGRYSYFRCNGTIRKLSGDERAIENKKVLDEDKDIFAGAAPTDSFHDDMQDIRGSTVTYKCDKCGDLYTLRQAVSSKVDSGAAKCQRIICDTCGRFPDAEGLPDSDVDADDTPLKQFYFN